MKHYPLLLLLLCLNLSAISQIRTPDFQYYTSCPTGVSQVDKCKGWVQPTFGTSDYFNACGDKTTIGVPQNMFGYQASSTNAYMGLFAYNPNTVWDYKEYIGTSFPPLVVGQTYTMTITVSLSDNSYWATDGLGVFFSTYKINDQSRYTTLPVTPQVDYSSYGIIKDKTNWVTLSKSFVADSAYTYLVVGCFKPTGIIQVDYASGSNLGDYAYYYFAQIGDPDSSWHGIPDSTQEIKPAPGRYQFPTAFTPNYDGHNDIFGILTSQGTTFENYTLSVYNRWGDRVFFTDNQTQGWDGKLNGEPQDMAVYFYYARFKESGKEQVLKGDVTLVR